MIVFKKNSKNQIKTISNNKIMKTKNTLITMKSKNVVEEFARGIFATHGELLSGPKTCYFYIFNK